MKKNRKKSPKFIGSEIFNSHIYPFVEYFFYQFDQIKKKIEFILSRKKPTRSLANWIFDWIAKSSRRTSIVWRNLICGEIDFFSEFQHKKTTNRSEMWYLRPRNVCLLLELFVIGFSWKIRANVRLSGLFVTRLHVDWQTIINHEWFMSFIIIFFKLLNLDICLLL